MRRRPVEEDIEELRATLLDAVREQMISDVPLGAFLSGGIDSTIIAGLMQKASNRPVKTFAIGFPDPDYDETGYAELAARHLGTEHQTFIVEPKAWETLPELCKQFDEPFADSSALPTWYVSRETRRHVTVALTGDAGDELFGGYDRYRALGLTELFQRLPEGPRRLLGRHDGAGVASFCSVEEPSSQSCSGFSSTSTIRPSIGTWAGCQRLTKPTGSRFIPKTNSIGWPRAAPHCRQRADADPAAILASAFALAWRRDPITRAMVSDLVTYLPGDLLVEGRPGKHGAQPRMPRPVP